jgi:tripartite ATP-independent transporter DctM subunit
MLIFVIGILILFLAAGIPVAFAIGLASVCFALLGGTTPVPFIVQQMYKGIDVFPLLAIPFFMLAGELMVQARIVDRIVEFINLLVGGIRGGLAHVNIVGSMFFAGITGSGSADTAALGSILIPAMTKSGYKLDYSVAVTCSSSVVGPIIPPSITMVLYGTVVPVSIGGLFAGGMIPGILIGLSLMVVAYVFSIKKHHPKSLEKFNFKDLFISSFRTLPAIMMPIIILGGILSGVFTPTEASAAACGFALFAGIVIYRTLTVRNIIESFANAAMTSSIILLIGAVSNPFAQIITFLNVPLIATKSIYALTSDPLIALMLMMAFMLFMTAVMESAACVFILSPILAPVAMNFGIDPLHFGVLFVMTICIGLATPPFGLCLFIGAAIGRISLERLMIAVLPFVAAEIIVLSLCVFFPQIILYFPKVLGFI